MNLSDKVLSAIRTGVPMLVGLVVSYVLVHFGFAVPENVQTWLEGLLTFGIGYGYYLAVRGLEGKWPNLGWLLGAPAQPVYNTPSTMIAEVKPGAYVVNPPNAP